MTAIFNRILKLDAAGAIHIVDSSALPSRIENGLPREATGALCVDIDGVIGGYLQTLPKTAQGRIAASIDGVVDRVAGGVTPLDAGGLLALGTGPIARVTSGVGFTAANQIAVTIAAV